MSRGSTCFTRHWFTPVGGHGVPRPTKMAGKIEKKVFWMPYTQQGVSGGSGWILRTPPLRRHPAGGISFQASTIRQMATDGGPRRALFRFGHRGAKKKCPWPTAGGFVKAPRASGFSIVYLRLRH